MPTLTPFFQFGTISGVESVSYSLSRGTAPSTCTLTIPPMPGLDFDPKPMVWSDGVRTVKFNDCKITSVVPSVGGDGFERWTVSIWDRRWRWKFGQVSGRYNVRHGGVIRKDTQKTVRQLAEICLKAMGEKVFDVSKMPNDTYPYLDWILTPPSAALDQLCQIVNCHVTLNELDRVVIWPDGMGKDLPALPSSSQGVTFDIGARPGKVNVVSAPAVWQLNFDLVAVGLDKDNQIKPVWDLSYMPLNKVTNEKTWENEQPPFTNVKKEYRKLAQETVWKWYQIVPPGWIDFDRTTGRAKVDKKYGLKTMPGTSLKINSSLQFFPLLDHQISYSTTSHVLRSDIQAGEYDAQLKSRRPAEVYGLWYDGQGNSGDNYDAKLINQRKDDDSDELDAEGPLRFSGGFSIDQERGLVIFADPVFKFYERVSEGESKSIERFIGQASIILRTGSHFYDSDTHVAYRHKRWKQIAGAPDPSLELYFAHEDVVPEFMTVYDWREYKAAYRLAASNLKEAEKKLDYYLGYEVKKFESRVPAFSRYPWMQPYAPDGLIAQVNYEIDGEGRISTTINREKEGLSNIPGYDEQRQATHLKTMLKRDSESKRNQDG